MYFLPEQHGGTDLKQHISEQMITDISENVVIRDYANEYTEYFDYVTHFLNIPKPTNWREALDLYEKLLSVSNFFTVLFQYSFFKLVPSTPCLFDVRV